MIEKTNLAKSLTYAGMLPFIGMTIAILLDIDLFGLNKLTVISAYAAVIAAFISGIHWGLYLLKDSPLNLFIHSNIVTLIAWAALLLAYPVNWLIFIACFVYLLLIDKQLTAAGLLEAWYLRMRILASTVVISCLAVLFIFQVA